jgi:hypothetical protein
MNNTDLEKNIKRIISELSEGKGYICSIDVLLGLNYLTRTDYEKWRNGQVECLEKICQTNLSKLTTINKIIRQVATKMKLEPSLTVYNKYGKGPKQRLRFSKSGDFNIEKAYSTHFLNKYRIEKIKENKNIPEDNHD